MIIILSIRGEFVDGIASGEKRYELRRRIPQLNSGDTIWIYSTSPRMEIVGSFTSGKVIEKPLKSLWRIVGASSMLSLDGFTRYFAGLEKGYGIEVGKFSPLRRPISLTQFRLIWPDFSPPQSFRYVPHEIEKKLNLMWEKSSAKSIQGKK